ncbi:hypothetical protein F5J12DRAFT_785053 [Pisolithus orientalis]|uniref:uncharacterized protein n=1 Tax=Pisolithus orientalis TaxID=936130 RepID=UPI0022247899|nr:uncharacterized protein F5J12DRAFT_785053 [Pisolithus orientalis]KAI5997836.1 hypothetical protein F5J12DRAFT_785053 [Pisolithus orientalis]
MIPQKMVLPLGAEELVYCMMERPGFDVSDWGVPYNIESIDSVNIQVQQNKFTSKVGMVCPPQPGDFHCPRILQPDMTLAGFFELESNGLAGLVLGFFELRSSKQSQKADWEENSTLVPGEGMSNEKVTRHSVAVNKHNSPGVLPPQQKLFTPYSPQSPINQVNGAYMQQELHITFLQDCCNVLEWHLVKVTMECDTIKNLFDKLTNVVNLGTCNLSLLRSNSPLQLLMTTGENPPLHDTHPKVQCWTRKDYEDWLDSPEAGGSNHGLYAYLEDKNGDVPLSEMLTKIQRALCAGWIELTQHKIAPDTWGRASMTALQFIQAYMEKDFPLFKLAESGWKLKHLCMKTYLAWRTKCLDENGETFDDDKDLKSLNPSSKKHKGPADASLRPFNRKQKSTAALQSWDPSESLKLMAPDSSSTSVDSAAHVESPIQGKVNVLPVPPITESQQNINPNGQKEDFHVYWDKMLSPAVHKTYNNEAKELVAKNTWTKSIIE